MALFGGLIHTLVCFFFWYQGIFRTSLENFILLFSVLWIVHITFLFLIISNLNLKFRDQSLTIPQLAWSEITIMISIYFTNELRTLLLLFTLFGIIFGAFRLTTKQLLGMAVFTVVLYVGTIALLWFTHPELIIPLREAVIAITFSFVIFSFVTVVAELSITREHLHKQRMELESSLYITRNDAETDELTGLKNRRFILEILNQQRSLVERHRDYCFSLALFDIDQFKHINDTFGHPVGDKVLQTFSKVINEHLRKTDYFARMGGEEFLLIAPFTRKDQVRYHAERLREAIENTNFEQILMDLKITCSVGVTNYKWPEQVEETLNRVDKALYLAKNSGRNRIEEE